MTDNELLLQITNIVNSNSKYLEYRIDQLDEKLSKRIDNVEAKLTQRIDDVEAKLTQRIDNLEQQIIEVDQRLSSQIAEVDRRLSYDIKRICVNIEHDLQPRLQTIESCYIDTNRRHNANIEKIETLEMNMDIVQSVLKDHIEYINQQTA